MSVRDQVVAGARKWVGTSYDWGGEGENGQGVDCSGLVIAAYRAAGRPLSGRPVASQLGKMGSAVQLADAQPGDVVYYDEPGPTDHVGIYIGGGQMIDAPYTGANVRVDAVGKPTSVRRLLTGWDSRPDANPNSDASTNLANTLGNIFVPGYGLIQSAQGDWSGQALAIGLKLVGSIAAVALVVVGVIHTVKDEG